MTHSTYTLFAALANEWSSDRFRQTASWAIHVAGSLSADTWWWFHSIHAMAFVVRRDRQ